MADEAKSKLITPMFRLSFPALFTPKADIKGELKYSCNMLFTKDTNLEELRNAAKAAAIAKWGNEMPKGVKSPFKLGDEKEYDGYAGMIYVNAWSKQQPGLVDQNVQAIMDQKDLYAGCYCRARVTVFPWEAKGPDGKAIINRGVSFGLMNVQKMKDGEPFGNRSNPTDDFTAVAAEGAGKSAGAPGPAKSDEWL